MRHLCRPIQRWTDSYPTRCYGFDWTYRSVGGVITLQYAVPRDRRSQYDVAHDRRLQWRKLESGMWERPIIVLFPGRRPTCIRAQERQSRRSLYASTPGNDGHPLGRATKTDLRQQVTSLRRCAAYSALLNLQENISLFLYVDNLYLGLGRERNLGHSKRKHANIKLFFYFTDIDCNALFF